MLPAGALGLISDAMVALNYEQAIIDEVVELLKENSGELESGKQEVVRVGPDWFGGAPTAYRLGVNTEMAHQAVSEEFQKLAESLLQYRDAVTTWGQEVLLVDADTTAEMAVRAQAVEAVHAKVDAATREAADETIGDGRHDGDASSPSSSREAPGAGS